MSDMYAVVTGANRGLGAALAEALLDRGATVALAVRPAADAEGCRRLLRRYGDRGLVVRLDYTDPESIRRAAAECAGTFDRVDALVNCGAVNRDPDRPAPASKGPLERLDGEALTRMFRVNVAGPIAACAEFLPLLRRAARPAGARIANVSTSRASLHLAEDAGSIGYATTKAALNMATRKLAAELGPLGISVFAVDPGWVATRMGGPQAPSSAADAAADLVELLLGDPPRTGFVDRYGKPLPW